MRNNITTIFAATAFSDEETEEDLAEQNKRERNDDKEKQIRKVKQQVNAIEKDVSPKTQRSPKYRKSGKTKKWKDQFP